MNKDFKDLDLSNAFLFSAALEDPETCQIVLEIILGRKISKVNVHSEHNILLNSNFRSVRLDIYAQDELQVGYDIEAQNKDEYNLPKRSRYHQAEMDVSSLKPGEDFNALKPGYVIFICTFDPFGKGLYRYTFEERCLETDMSLGDETRKIFLNTKGKNDNEVPRELIDFLHYMEESTTEYVSTVNETSLIRLHERVSGLKRRRELEARFMTLEEYVRQEIEERLEEEFKERLPIELENRVQAALPLELENRVQAALPLELENRVQAALPLELENRAQAEVENRLQTEIEDRVQAEIEKQKNIYFSEARTKALVDNILELLGDYGSIPDELRNKILAQSNIDVLKIWFKIAARTTSIDDFEKQISDNT